MRRKHSVIDLAIPRANASNPAPLHVGAARLAHPRLGLQLASHETGIDGIAGLDVPRLVCCAGLACGAGSPSSSSAP